MEREDRGTDQPLSYSGLGDGPERDFFGWGALLLCAYGIVALIFLAQTYREGVRAGGAWDMPRIAGLFLCAFWPALVLFMLGYLALWRPAPEGAKSGAAADAPSTKQPARLVSIFGVRMTDQPFDDALRHVGSMLAAGGRHTLFFANVHTLNLAAASKEYRTLLRQADAVFGDGTGVRWAARLRGVRLAANLNGTDLVPALLRQRPGLRCFILGSAEDRISRIEQSFRRIFPSCDLAGAHHGYIDHETSLQVIEAINRSKADLLLVGMGNPLQERWICRYRAELDIPLVVGVGGLFEYWSGTLDRAPLWMRRGGIEWVHILRRQPWKARRYLIGNLQFIWRNVLWIGSDLRRQEFLQQ